VPGVVQAEGGVGVAAEDEAQGGAAFVAGPAVFVAGPAVFAAFELADPARVYIVRRKIAVRKELIEARVDSGCQLGAGHGLSRPHG
jgi:hypothetical protein